MKHLLIAKIRILGNRRVMLLCCYVLDEAPLRWS